MIDGFLIAMLVLTTIAVTLLALSNVRLWIELKAMQNSTHNIQWMDPVDILRQSEGQKLTKEEEKDLSNDPLNSII